MSHLNLSKNNVSSDTSCGTFLMVDARGTIAKCPNRQYGTSYRTAVTEMQISSQNTTLGIFIKLIL